MTDEAPPPDVIDDKSTDVLAEDEVVHVPPATEELVESQDPGSTFLPDVPDWDEPEH
jgi:hypothetical protein